MSPGGCTKGFWVIPRNYKVPNKLFPIKFNLLYIWFDYNE